MTAEYYACWYRLDGQDRYLIWYTNDVDGILLRDGNIPVFNGQDALIEYAAAHGIKIQDEEPELHDLDVVAKWVERPTGNTIDCSSFNAAWNLFADASKSVKGEFDQDQKSTKKVYEKLFCGTNLPSVTPVGKEYEPIWTNKEVELLREVLAQGLELFQGKTTEV
jgi:hypothetical protein